MSAVVVLAEVLCLFVVILCSCLSESNCFEFLWSFCVSPCLIYVTLKSFFVALQLFCVSLWLLRVSCGPFCFSWWVFWVFLWLFHVSWFCLLIDVDHFVNLLYLLVRFVPLSQIFAYFQVSFYPLCVSCVSRFSIFWSFYVFLYLFMVTLCFPLCRFVVLDNFASVCANFASPCTHDFSCCTLVTIASPCHFQVVCQYDF